MIGLWYFNFSQIFKNEKFFLLTFVHQSVMMKNSLIALFICFVFVTSCKKQESWETPLDGVWVEESNNNARSLPSKCTIQFQKGTMVICDESVGKDLNKDSKIYAQNGQIWISYKLSFRKHEEYRYDYEFEGEYLWIMEETTSNFNSVINHPKAKKYRKK